MQYAIVRAGDAEFIIDAAECAILEKPEDSVLDGSPPDESLLALVYGAYIPQPGLTEAQANESAQSARGFWLGTVDEKLCHAIGLKDVKFFDPIRLGQSYKLPFAALINIGPEALALIKNDTVKSLTCFMRYRKQMSPVTNILNRPGIFAVKMVDKWVEGGLSAATWQDKINNDRVLYAASRVQ